MGHDLITYRGGSSGDFLRLLLFTGDPIFETISISDYGVVSATTKTGLNYKSFSQIKNNGKVELLTQMSSIDDMNRKFFDRVRYHLSKDNLDEFIFELCRFRNTVEKSYKFDLSIDVSTSHDYFVYLETFGGLEEFYLMVNTLGFEKVIFISVTTEKSIKLRLVNSLVKNHNQDVNSALSEYHENLSYRHERDSMLQYKRSQDTIIELEDIFDKTKIKNIISNLYHNWSDKHFDLVYDFYIKRQLYLGD